MDSGKDLRNSHDEKFTGNYFQWIKSELSGWDSFPWAIFSFAAGFELAIFLLGKINLISSVSFVSTLFGLLCVVAMSARGHDGNGKVVVGHAINGLLGAISVLGYIYINYTAGHWFSILDQLIFFAFIDAEMLIMWRTWGRGEDQKLKTLVNFNGATTFKEKAKRYVTSKWPLIIIIILASWFILYHIGLVLNDSNPVWDSLTLAIGATASFLYFRRYTQTYSLWMLSNLVNLILWLTAFSRGYSQAALPMLVMTAFYNLNALYGRWVFRQKQ